MHLTHLSISFWETCSPLCVFKNSSYLACLAASFANGLKLLCPDQILEGKLTEGLDTELTTVGGELEALGTTSFEDNKIRSLSSLDTNSKTDFLGVGMGSSPSISPLSEAVKDFLIWLFSSDFGAVTVVALENVWVQLKSRGTTGGGKDFMASVALGVAVKIDSAPPKCK